MNSISTTSPKTAVTYVSKGVEQPDHQHCPLCVDSMVHPKKDDRKPAIIFLDMDGVMIKNRHSSPLRDEIVLTLSKLFPDVKRYNDYQWTIAKGRHLHPTALENLHKLIKRIKKSGHRALVVLSSAWRNDATLQQLKEEAFTNHVFCKYLCGKAAPKRSDTRWTPECKQGFKFTKGAKEAFRLNLESRSDVIEFWLRDHGFDPNSTNFIVIDDCVGKKRERFGKRFIETDNLFKDCHLEEASKVLKVLKV